jgi:cell division transport system permease protein
MNAWLTSHIQACGRALRRLRAQPLASVLSIVVIGIALALPLGLYLLFANVSTAAGRLNAEPRMNVFLALSASNEDAAALGSRLKAMPNAASVRFISREAALEELKRTSNLGDLLAGMETNPLPHAFAIVPASFAPEALEAMRREISALAKVEAVSVEFEWARKLARFSRFAQNLAILFALALCAAVVFVTGNTIRLQMLTQKEEIVVARLIGATRRFVRRPFLYYGAIQGAVAGLLATILVVLLIAWIGQEASVLASSYGSGLTLVSLSPGQSLSVILLGAFLGWLGSYVSVSLFLQHSE